MEKALLADDSIENTEVIIQLKNNSAINSKALSENENLGGIKRIIAIASGKGGVRQINTFRKFSLCFGENEKF